MMNPALLSVPEGTSAQDTNCVSCYDGCATCTSPQSNRCLTCESGFNLASGECVLSCPAGSAANSDNQCESTGACEVKCETCSDKPDYCLSCDDGLTLDILTSTCVTGSVDECSGEYYYSSALEQCQKCLTTQCADCVDSATQCTECPPYYGKILSRHN